MAVTLKDIYDVVDSRFTSLEKRLDDIQEVTYKNREDFMTMEKGRLTRLEGDFRQLAGQIAAEKSNKNATHSKAFWLVMTLVGSTAFGVTQTIIVSYLIK